MDELSPCNVCDNQGVLCICSNCDGAYNSFVPKNPLKKEKPMYSTEITSRCLDDNGLVPLSELESGTVFLGNRDNCLYMVTDVNTPKPEGVVVTYVCLNDGIIRIHDNKKMVKPMKSIHITYHRD